MMKVMIMTGAALAIAGCASAPRNTGTSYECDRGTKLKVDYVRDGAIVRVNGRQTLVLRATPANRGEIYENRTGARLHRDGNQVTWNTAARSAPETCRAMIKPL